MAYKDQQPIDAIGATGRTAFTDLIRDKNDKPEEDIAAKKQEQKKRLSEEMQKEVSGKAYSAVPNVGSASVFTAYMPTVNSQGSGDTSNGAGFLASKKGQTGTA